jgi:tryptophan-rich sensory protein
MDRRAELEGWIAKTHRLQRRLAFAYAALGIVAIAVFAWSRVVGGFAIFGVALVAVCSFWVTAAHNAAHRQKLAELARVEENEGKPLETGHRRWAPRER